MTRSLLHSLHRPLPAVTRLAADCRLSFGLSCWLILASLQLSPQPANAGTGAPAQESLSLSVDQQQRLGLQMLTLTGQRQGQLKNLPGRVVVPSGQEQWLVTPLEASLQEFLVSPGMPVKQGQILARLVSPQVLELQRDATQARVRATQTRQALQRDTALFAEGLIARTRLEATQALAAEAEAESTQRHASLQLAGAQPGRISPVIELKARFDGVVLEQRAQVGERLTAATPIARLGRLQPLWIELQAPRHLAAQVQPGDALSLHQENQQAGAGKRLMSGKIIAVGRAVHPDSQNVMLRAEIRADCERLTPGEAVTAEITVRAAPNTAGIALPAAALVREAGQTLVFVASPGDPAAAGSPPAASQRFSARPVRVIGPLGESLLVEGLAAGEQVVVHGLSSLRALQQQRQETP